MTILEIILIIIGILCVVFSIAFEDKNKDEKEHEVLSTELTEQQKDKIKEQVNEIIDEQINGISEKTEASLDKISNTKILEMNEYAENVLGEINRNHNETVFLYDMLNEKAKEIKTTVKDVNMTKRQVEKIHAEVNSQDSASQDNDKQSGNIQHNTENVIVDDRTVANRMEADKTDAVRMNTGRADNIRKSDSKPTKDVAKERLVELVRQNNEKKKENVEAASNNQAKKVVEAANKSQDTEEPAKAKRTRTKTTKTATAKTTSKGTKEAAKTSKEISFDEVQFEKGATNNDKILKLHELGMANKDIARQLNLGIGEVKLVIDLYKNK